MSTGVGGERKDCAGDQRGKKPSSSSTDHHQVPVDQSRKRSSVSDALPTKNNNLCGKDELLYTELWRACAGPLVYVPCVGDTVYYILQGHLEQIEAYTDHDVQVEMPIYNLPSKILCEVARVQLNAEAGTDEVFAQIALVPKRKEDEQSLEDQNSPPLPPKTKSCSFSKKLTQSDTSTHGGFSVPKRHADECLPHLDLSKEPPAQELIAKDLHGYEWPFRHIFRGQPKRHLLTSGWSTFVTSKKLLNGDSCIFLRGEHGELCVGVRRARKQQNKAPSIISAHSMQHGILATALQAISTGRMFTVYYHPWTSPSEFIVPFDQYVKSTEIDYSVGTRIGMVFEGEDCAFKRIAGTILGTKDFDQIRWPHSEWRCLQVKWDDVSDKISCPERVSPWNVELISPNNKPASVLHRQKRPRPDDDASLPGGSNGVLQGQENRVAGVEESGPLKQLLLPYMVPQKNPDWGSSPMHDPFYICPNGTVSVPSGSIVSSGLPNSGSQQWRSLESKNENESSLSQPRGGSSKCMLFGVNLISSPPELPSLQATTSNEESLCSVPPMSQSSISETFQVSEPSKSVSGIPSGKQCKNCCLSKSCTKVLKYGTALGRSVDLTRFDGYEELVYKLDQMFDFNGSLIDGSSRWDIIFTDHEGDMMLIGDQPWQEFQCTVRIMFICPKEDIDKLNPSSPNPIDVSLLLKTHVCHLSHSCLQTCIQHCSIHERDLTASLLCT